MNKVIIRKLENNEVTITFPALNWENKLDELVAKNIPPGTPYKIINVTELPQTGEFLDALIWDDTKENKISFNISKAKEIWKDKFREARKPILEKLDVEFIRALEAGDTQKQQEIASKKQALRDVTNISLPDSLEGIKNTWPNILNS